MLRESIHMHFKNTQNYDRCHGCIGWTMTVKEHRETIYVWVWVAFARVDPFVKVHPSVRRSCANFNFKIEIAPGSLLAFLFIKVSLKPTLC